jgi:acetyl esterase/lipase
MLAFGGITPPAGAVQGVDLFAKKPAPRPHIFAARGFSAGGENAAWTAVAAPVPGTNDPAPSILPAALVLLSPGTKVASYPMTANMPPTLLFHATGDKTIPYSNSVAFRDQMVRTLSGGREVVYFWRLGMHLFFSGFSSLVEAKSTSSLGGFSSFEPR